MPAIISLDHVSKFYGPYQALKNISLEIPQGHIFGFIGPNGAGKTTTIKILVGLITDYTGTILIQNRTLREMTRDLHRILGYLPQDVGFQEWRTVDHVLNTFGRLSGLDGEKLEQRITYVLNLFELADWRNKKVVHLSGGMQQKLRFAQALLHQPEIIIMDEPMNQLDPTARYHVKQVMKDLSRQGITILLSSHILSDIEDIATTIGIIHQGTILQVGTPASFQSAFHLNNTIELEIQEGSTWPDLSLIAGIRKRRDLSPWKCQLAIEGDMPIDTVLHALFGEFHRQTPHIRKCAVVRPSLEEVYLQFIGSPENRSKYLGGPSE